MPYMEVMKKKELGNELPVQAVWFAAGTAAFMACLERAVLVSFVEQWRVLVFLALNLLLLAILFTSRHPNCLSDHQEAEKGNNVSSAEEEKGEAAEVETLCRKQESSADDVVTALTAAVAATKENVGEAADDVKSDMSKDELNERAEAFIAKFRQHLASDAKTNFGYSRSRSFCVVQSPTAKAKGGDQILSRRRSAISYATHSGTRMRL